MKSVHSCSGVLMLVATALVGACNAVEPSTQGDFPVATGVGPATGAAAGAGGAAAGGTTAGSVAVPGTTAGTGGGLVPGVPVVTTPGATTAQMDGPCEKKVRTAGKTVPDFMIVLDRSGSMRPSCLVDIPFVGKSTAPDCMMRGVDCTMADMNTIVCGGMQPSKLDRWAPAVSALKSLTTMFQTKVSFGLTVFPGEGGGGGGGPGGAFASCAAGQQSVPVGLNTAGPIAKTLDGMLPTGATPTASTLQEVLNQIQAKKTSPDMEVPPQYVLLVTDGAPTCSGNMYMPNGTQPHQDTIAAIDALAKAGVKTYVIGYDASVDPNLAKQLAEYAQHGGTSNFYAVQDGPSLVSKFTEITNVIAECTYTLDKEPADKRYVRVELDKESLPVDNPDGWSVSGKTVTINGAACTKLRDGSKTHTLAVTVECVIVDIN